MSKSFWRKLWTQERGFTLLEAVAAVFIAGTAVVGSVVVMGTAARTSSNSGKNLDLQQYVQTQIEMIQNSPFDPDGDYALITDLPPGTTITIETSDSGTNYSYPGSSGAPITNVVQRVDVTAADGIATVTMSFYNVEDIET